MIIPQYTSKYLNKKEVYGDFKTHFWKTNTLCLNLKICLCSTISAHINNTEEENLSNLQKHINYDQINSIDLLTKLISDIRRISIEETKRNNRERNAKEKSSR